MQQYGLIGYPLSHSFSKQYFTEKFEKEGIEDAHYQLYPIASIQDLSQLLTKEKNLSGLNVTMPYKQVVIPFLHDLSAEAKEIGAVNTIKIDGTKLTGYNTDALGFEATLQKVLPPDFTGKALVLGNGGAAQAVKYVLRHRGIDFQTVSRSEGLAYSQLDKAIINNHLLIINTTILGTYPNVDDCPLVPYEFVGNEHIAIDLVYNPTVTLFLKNMQKQGAIIENGLYMLHQQAEAAWQIWNT